MTNTANAPLQYPTSEVSVRLSIVEVLSVNASQRTPTGLTQTAGPKATHVANVAS